MKGILPLTIAVLILAIIPTARAKDDKWIEARSANFIVVSNASAQQARDTAIQFEQIRELFQLSFTYARNRPTPTITILAAKDENTLRELLPEFWAEKGRMHPAGIFVNSFYQMNVAVQLSGMGDNPYQTIYHEYYHSLTVPYFPGLPVWVAEGMADFYGNSRINGKEAFLGMPDFNLARLFHERPLIPLSTLFQVDHDSPYYNEGSKVSIFYAESWALIHYLMMGEKGTRRHELGTYLGALAQGASQEEAAAKAFGDLGKLEKALQSYVSSSVFYQLQAPAPAKIPESEIRTRSLSDAEAGAYRGGFLALRKQFREADALLQQAVHLDPKLALVQQNLGVFYYLQNQSGNALAAFSAAIELDPKNSLSHFLRAQLVSSQSGSGQSDSQVETDLRAAIAANPNFAPAYGLLASHLTSRGEHLPDALEFAKKGATLEPGNSTYQLGLARTLARMRQYDQAQTVALSARANALDPSSKASADQFIEFLRRIRDTDARKTEPQDRPAAKTYAVDTMTGSVEPRPEETQVNDGRNRIDGTIADVRCKGQTMEIAIAAENGILTLQSSDYTNIEFISDLPIKSEEFWPCTALKGRIVRVAYLPNAPSKNRLSQGEIVKLEIKR